MGYNVQDGLVYGVSENFEIATLSSTQITALPGSPILPPANVNPFNAATYNAGDMDLCGNLYVSGFQFDFMLVINVSEMTFNQIPLNIPVDNNRLWCPDWTYLPATGLLYGITNDVLGNFQSNAPNHLRVMDLQGNHVLDIPLTGAACVGYGAMFADALGNLYAYCNASGDIIMMTPTDDTFTDFTVTTLFTETQGISGNDGASCPLSNGLSPTEETCCSQVLALLKDQKKQISRTQSSNDIASLREELEELQRDRALSKEEAPAVLYQNKPNPFSEKTVIKYEITDKNAEAAVIFVFDLNGNLKLTYPIEVEKRGEVIIEGETLGTGMYLYTLVVDNVAIDSKKMILTE